MTVQPTESTVPSGGEPAETSGTPVLELRDVAVHFGGVKAVDGITMTLEPGLIYGIIGPNGSGKTTLIGAITRLTQLTRGDMLFDGESYTTARPSRLVDLGVARTFQTVRLLPDLDVARNIQLGADTRGKARGSGRRPGRARRPGSRDSSPAAARRLRRSPPRSRAPASRASSATTPPSSSYGTQRRVEIARAMAMDPRLLLLDEPTAGMNQAERAEISALLRDMRSEGSLCQLLVEHDVQMMIDTCDYVFAMNTGKLIAEGEPREVVQNPLVQEAYLGRKLREHARDRRPARQLRPRRGRAGCEPDGAAGEDHARSRAERGGQDHDAEGGGRAAAAGQRHRHPGGHRHHRRGPARHRPPGRGAGARGSAGVRPADRRREPAAGRLHRVQGPVRRDARPRRRDVPDPARAQQASGRPARAAASSRCWPSGAR